MNIARAYRGKVCVVTGSASGMGGATARVLAAAGAYVYGLDIREQAPEGVKSSRIDLADAASIDHAVAELPAGIDCVFACAGLPQTFPAVDVVTVNFLGARQFIEGVLRKVSKGGAIATIASAAGNAWLANYAGIAPLLATASIAEGRQVYEKLGGEPYTVSKQCLVAYTTINASRFIGLGVRLNTLSPGMTDTPMLPEFRKANPEAMARVPVPIGRPSSAEEQAVAMLLLNHPEATYLVGANLANDGGMVPAIVAGSLRAAAAQA